MFADVAGKKEESERLFNVAIRAGRQFLEALTSGRIPEAEVRSQVPIGITLKLGRPSIDFMLGRIYEDATENAYDKIVNQDENGLPQAERKYGGSNCILIR